MNYTSIFKDIGNKTSEFSMNSINKISEVLGTETSSFSIKLLTLLLLLGGLILALKFTEKIVRVVLVIVVVVLIISIGFTFI